MKRHAKYAHKPSRARTAPVCMLLLLSAFAARPQPDGFVQPALEEFYARLTPAIGIVRYAVEVTNPNTGEITKRDNLALALVVSPDGLVMTHGHMVLENAQPFNIRVTLGRGDSEQEYEAVLLKKPDDVNVAFLRLKSARALNLPHVRFARGVSLALAQPVALFGLLGEPFDYARCLIETRIGAILDKPRTTYCLDDAVRYGFVGAPVVDTAGRVVGVVGFDLNRAEGGDLYVRSGHPLVYQTDLFQRYLDHPPSETEIETAEEHAWFGVFTQPLTDRFAEYWNLPASGGLIISTVVPGSPAAQSGLRAGDVIVEFDGTPIRAKLDREVLGFTKLVREAGAGRELPVKVLRDGQPLELKTVLGTRPRSAQEAGEYEDPHFGLTVRELTTDVRIALNLPENVEGVIVRRVKSGSIAQLAKMRPGVVILRFGGHLITNLADFQAAVEKAAAEKPPEVVVFGRLGPATGFFRLEPRWEER
ncbi:MAG: PDZ domain-containing protein [Candidatus Hydrogenedentes bacterium]|nr:PDZ domain-containing protein [Candidatus Hydrogenedentota bacterium]